MLMGNPRELCVNIPDFWYSTRETDDRNEIPGHTFKLW
jgi:hypothetical protein